jgi:hypothetical protein
MPNRRQILRALPFVALWIGGLALFSRFNWVFDYDTITREVEPLRSLAYGLPRLTVEVLVLYLILRPNSFRWSWGRVLLALAVFVPWFIYSIAFIMHAPGWVFAHAYWLLAVVASLVILLVVSAVGAWRGSRRAPAI